MRGGRDAGRIAALENRRFNLHHGTREAQFYLFDSEDDPEAAAALVDAVADWARRRGLNRLVGPRGFGPFDGNGILVDGFEERQMMTLMPYNFPYYPRLIEGLGFHKEVDFLSYTGTTAFRMPEEVRRAAERTLRRGILTVQRLRSRRDIRTWAPRVATAYNRAFVKNWEFYPLTEREVAFLVDMLMLVADPRLIALILYAGDVAGFVLAFRDLSAGLQQARGRLWPLGILHLLLEMRRTRSVAIMGAGIVPELQGRGGNAVLYTQMEHLIRGLGLERAEMTQIADTAVQMRRDIERLGVRAYKRHRVYAREL